jgi:phospholipid-binding lipoprotein MlaA
MPASPLRALSALAVVLLLSACATTSSTTTNGAARRDQRDPFEKLNRGTFAFNDAVDRAVLRPVARGYRNVTPQFVQTGVTNFFRNAKYPTVIVNDVLQAKFRPAGRDTLRFVFNTTFGLAGLLDPATPAGLERNDEDFGQTLGKWGVHPGPYIMVPLLGPYTLRDGIGSIADQYTEPRHYVQDSTVRWSLWAFEKLDRRARLLDGDVVLDRTGDKYAFVRSAYLQRREYLVRDGDVPADEPPEDDPAADDADLDSDPKLDGPKLDGEAPKAPQ